MEWKHRKASFAPKGWAEDEHAGITLLHSASQQWAGLQPSGWRGSCANRTGRRRSPSQTTREVKLSSGCCKTPSKVVAGLGSRSPVSGRQPYKLAWVFLEARSVPGNKRTQKPNQIANQSDWARTEFTKARLCDTYALGCKGSEGIFVTDAPGLSKNNIPLSPSLPFGLGLKFSSPWSFWPNSMNYCMQHALQHSCITCG